jgi:hypothetical protein
MSSFYGNYGGTGGGAGGTSDYNDLSNKPLINITGSSTSPVVLNTLNYGCYMIKGSFVYTAKDTDVKTVSYQNYIEITQDTVSGRKVANFSTFEDGAYYIYNIYFNDDETCLVDKTPIKKSDGGIIFLKEEDLPDIVGVESTLYVTELAIYQWKDGEWFNMNALAWGEF